MGDSGGLFAVPPEHAAALEEVKRALGIHHRYLDGWVYLFLVNKKFDVAETVAKLQRRDEMERSVFASYSMTDSLRASMRAGIVQYIGRDRDGHPVLYFNTARDSPKAEQRPERQANMDMFLSWAVRCDKENPSSMVTWLINQKNASLLRNTDLIFQKDMALRISKYFPGVVGRMYICNMSSALTFVMKPLLRQLPSSISDCIFLFSAGDIRGGELLKRIDASVLPVEMGGANDCDNAVNYERFATTIEGYVGRCLGALGNGLSIKQMEMMEEFGVDKDGRRTAAEARQPLLGSATEKAVPSGSGQQMQESVAVRARMTTAASEETLDQATVQDPVSVTVDADAREITVQSSTVRRIRGGDGGSAADDYATANSASTALDWNMSFASPPVPVQSLMHRVPSSEWMDCVSVPGFSTEDSMTVRTAHSGLYHLELSASMDEFCFSSVLRRAYTQKPTEAMSEQRDACMRDWISFCCQCVEVAPKLEALLEALRRGAVVPTDDDLVARLRRCSHHMLNLFPQTHATLPFPLLDWYAAGATARYRAAAAHAGSGRRASDTTAAALDVLEINPRRLLFQVDCTTPDNVLLSAQAGAVEFVESWDDAIAVEQRKMRVERRVLLTWPPNTPRAAFEAQLRAKARQLWGHLCPHFRVYIEAKVGISIAEFIRHYGLLVAGGRINESAEWYRRLFTGVLQYREQHRRNWLFYVFPPLAQSEALGGEPPTMAELLAARGETNVTFDAAAALMALVEQSLQYTVEQLSSEATAGVVATRTTVERYLDVTKAKIYIPYDTQRTGVLPAESMANHKRAAAAALREAVAPLQEFLFTLASLFLLEHDYDATLSESAVKAHLQAAKTAHMRGTLERREHQRVAMSFARICAELQGSFGSDVCGLLTTYSAAVVRAEGYALGLEVLLAVAILRSGREGGEATGTSSSNGHNVGGGKDAAADLAPAPPPPQLQLSLSSEDDVSFASADGQLSSNRSVAAAKVEVASLIETLTAMEGPAARLASLKRLYIY